MEFKQKDTYTIEDLLSIMTLLRSPGGCPWDREQTHQSIRKNFLEETYEVLEAIDTKDDALLKEELGDVLLQVVFHARMAEEREAFSFDDVANDICQKLIVRHPHIFGEVKADTAEQVLSNWDDIKLKTKGMEGQSQSMQSVPDILPALMRSEKVQKKAAKVGYDWNSVYGVLDKLDEEIQELKQAIEEENTEGCHQELGDVLFTAVNVSRFLEVDAEEALTRSTNTFIKRFTVAEQLAKEQGIPLPNSDYALLDKLWEEAKEAIAQSNQTEFIDESR